MSGEQTDFLYPFIAAGERGLDALLADLAASARAKASDSAQLRARTIAGYEAELDSIAGELADRFRLGGRLFAFGNGGSSTDAASFAALFAEPPTGCPLPARTLASDEAILTALGNDVGFDLVFSRQLIAYATAGDVAVGFSTSGNSANLTTAFSEAKRRGLLTLGFAGYDGGQMAESPDVDHCLVVRSDSVHRVQESEDALAFSLWSRVQERIGRGVA